MMNKTTGIIEVPQNMDKTKEYHEGAVAYMLGLNDTRVCPYPSGHVTGNLRTRWMSGYWGEWVRQFLMRLESKMVGATN